MRLAVNYIDKMKNIICFISIVFSINTTCYSTPIITNFSATSSPIGVYDKFEISFSLNNYLNPFNDSQINTYCEFWDPNGVYYKTDAFFYEEFIKTDTLINTNDPFPAEILTATGNQTWRVRFTPKAAGQWSYRLIAIDANDSISYPSASTLNFSCVSANNKGFVVKANNKFLKRSTGEFFFPVGENIGWYGLANNAPPYFDYGTNAYVHYIDELSSNNANFMRVWLDFYYGMALVGKDYPTSQTYYDLYNLKDAWQLDSIFNYAKSKDVNIMLCLFTHSTLGNDSYCNNNWNNNNPFNSNNGGPLSNPFDFFTDNNAKDKTKEILDYVISRWGYATNLMSWELFNEVDKIPDFNSSLATPGTWDLDVLNWHSEMKNYIQEKDHYDHLITTSYASEIDLVNTQVHALMDIVQSHEYKNVITNYSHNIQERFFMISFLNRLYNDVPYFVGEWGFSNPQDWIDFDPNGIELHNSLWSSSFSTAFGAAANWWWDNYIEPKDLYSIFYPVGKFMNSLTIPSADFVADYLNSNGIRTFNMHNTNKDTIYGWAQDINYHHPNLDSLYISTLNPIYQPTPNTTNNEIVIDNLSSPLNTLYSVEWYNSQTADLHFSDTVLQMNNQITINMPLSLRESTFGDAVFKIIVIDNPSSFKRENHLPIKLFPNPTNETIKIEIEHYTGQVTAKVYDLTGKLLFTTNSTNISLKDYQKGVYLFKVSYADKLEEIRVVKH